MENEEKSLAGAATSPQLTKITKHITDDEECIENILLRLPAKSLHRYMVEDCVDHEEIPRLYVCKEWRDMIQEPRFKKLHFENNSRKSEPLQLLVHRYTVEDRVDHEEVMVLDKDLQPSNIWMPQDLGGDWHFRGSCNGLLCIEVKGVITVFNPVTREVVSLPKPHDITGYGSDESEEIYAEFVFHVATGEYKVILFYCNASSMNRYAVYLYVLGANGSWRHIGEISETPCNSGVNVDDVVYWPYLPMDGIYDPFIISFDLSKEQIATVPSPMQDAGGLTTWNGKLCEASFGEGRRSMNLWVYENLDWTLRHEIQLRGITEEVMLLAPYSITSNGVHIFTLDKIFYHKISGNPDNIQEILVKSSCEIKNCFAYVESLLPVPK